MTKRSNSRVDGRKSKGKKFERPREEWLSFATSELNEFELRITGSSTILPREVRDIKIETLYQRTNKPKLVHRIPLKALEISHHSDMALKENYDILIAIDTNRRSVLGIDTAVTAIVMGQFVEVDHGVGVFPSVPCWLEILEPRITPEKIGWIEGINALIRKNAIHDSQRIGLIVDSHLSELESINNRISSVHDDLYMPTNITLIYATSDASSSSIVNDLIKFADAASTSLIKSLEAGNIERQFRPSSETSAYRALRVIFNSAYMPRGAAGT